MESSEGHPYMFYTDLYTLHRQQHSCQCGCLRLQLILIIFVGTLWLHPDINKGTYTDVVYGISSEGIHYVYTT